MGLRRRSRAGCGTLGDLILDSRFWRGLILKIKEKENKS
jgi:hypothetical protein